MPTSLAGCWHDGMKTVPTVAMRETAFVPINTPMPTESG